MIFVLHGEDFTASYNRLQTLLKNFSDFEKVRLDEKSAKEEIITFLNSQDLLNSKQVLILENLLTDKRIDFDLINSASLDKQIIFWEKAKALPKSFQKITVKKTVEEYKPAQKLFYFLDSISQGSKKPLALLNLLPSNDKSGLIWQLLNRIFLLILIKMNLSQVQTAKIVKKPLQDWQWDKIANQSKNLELPTLKHLFAGLLKIEHLKKSGQTTLDEKTLISTLFIKYLIIQ